MTAPFLWIGVPIVLSMSLWFVRDYRQTARLLAASGSLFFALLALILPIGTVIQTGIWSFELDSSFLLLGRRLLINNGDRPLLVFMYSFSAFWFFGSTVATHLRYFPSFGMAIVAIFVAAISVEPFIYAALLIEMAVLISIPLLAPPGSHVNHGIYRYLIFQTLAVPCILFAGWASTAVEANPTDKAQLSQAVTMLGLGFAFWLAIFPFYAWVPLLTSETNPYIVGFMMSLLPTSIILLGLDFLNTFVWLRTYTPLLLALQITGTLMVVTGGIWAAFQKNLGRLFGYIVIVESGFSLLAISLGNPTGYQILVTMLLPRLIAMALWSLSLSVLVKGRGMDIGSLRGILYGKPVASIGILVALFSMGSFPILGGFPTRLFLLENLAAKSLSISLWVGVGILGLLISGLRLLSIAVHAQGPFMHDQESWQQSLLIIGGIFLLLLIGIFPHNFSIAMMELLNAFGRLF